MSNEQNSIAMFSLKNLTYTLVGLEPRSSAPVEDAMSTAPRILQFHTWAQIQWRFLNRFKINNLVSAELEINLRKRRLAARRSGHRVRLKNRRLWIRIPTKA
jgi:hypothetical protein